jgi:Flp pilus assembly protein TadD
LLDQLRPATVLKRLGDEVPIEFAIYKTEALLLLDRLKEAAEYLDPLVPKLTHDDFSRAERLWAEILLRQGWIDGAILSGEGAAEAAKDADLQAVAWAWSAIGYARKRCYRLAQDALRNAQSASPAALPLVRVAAARVRLEMDERLEARAIYEQLSGMDTVLARYNGAWGRAHIAWLLGEFDDARPLAQEALQFSGEALGPLFVLAQVALSTNDYGELKETVKEMARRSPQAESLSFWRGEVERLKAHRSRAPKAPPETRFRLKAFPTTAQKRDYCGPCTIELVLRYWQSADHLNSEQIAQSVKFPGGGSPNYKMREFFHLVGFDTVRCVATTAQLRDLARAGYPVIVQHEYSQSTHVAVVIGYDQAPPDGQPVIDLQDPMTHVISPMRVEEFERRRQLFARGALVAFPRGQGHDKALARMGIFDDPAQVAVDQAGLALDENRSANAADLLARATRLQPDHPLAWLLWINAEYNRWMEARNAAPPPVPAGSLAARLVAQRGEDVTAARARYLSVVAQAAVHHPAAEFVHRAVGDGAWNDGDLPRAVAAYQQACAADDDDAYNYVSLAAAHYALRDFEAAREAAQKARDRNPALPGANVWMARSLAARNDRYTRHYARCVLELAPDWWRAHQALAEALWLAEDYSGARRAVDEALAYAPNQPELKVLRARLLSRQGDYVNALLELEAVLAGAPAALLSPATLYTAYETQCRILFSANLFAEAAAQIQQLLTIAPTDPWGVQFLAAAQAEAAIQAQNTDPASLEAMMRQYDAGVAANGGRTWIARDYVNYLTSLAGAATGAEIAARLRATYPDNGALLFLHGQALYRAQQIEPAAQAFLEAVGRGDGIQNPDELIEATGHILEAYGPVEGERVILEAPAPEDSAPLNARERALGLTLATYPPEKGVADRARALLQAALKTDPDDAWVALRLGDVAPSDTDREALYRRALLLSSRWSFARARLAEFLLDHSRPLEALEFTDGHETETLDLLIAHGRGLIATGRAEAAVGVFTQAQQWTSAPHAVLYFYKWLAESDSGWHTEALATAQAAQTQFTDSPYWAARVATSLRALDRFDEAEACIVEGRAQGLRESDVLEAEYETAWARQDLPRALTAVEQLIGWLGEQTGDQRLGLWEQRRLRLLLDLKREPEARHILALENLSAAGWGEAAWTAMMAEAWALCLECADRALAQEPHQFAGLLTRAEALMGLAHEAEAVATYQALRDAHPDEHNAYEKLALRAAVEENDLNEALALAERGVALGPFCPFAWATRGYVRFVRGEPEPARADLETAWGRADADRRRHSNEFWWLLAALQGEAALATARRQTARAEAHTRYAKRILKQIERLLKA